MELYQFCQGGVIDESVYFTVCSEVVNHNNERERTESGALRHTATDATMKPVNETVA